MLTVNIQSELNVALLKVARINSSHREFPLIAEADERAASWLNKDTDSVWTVLRSALPVDCRCLVYGRAALVAPKSGEILAMVLGTFYILRVPPEGVEVARHTERIRKFTEYLIKQTGVDPGRDYGVGWIYGYASDEERQWCRAVYDAVESEGMEVRS